MSDRDPAGGLAQTLPRAAELALVAVASLLMLRGLAPLQALTDSLPTGTDLTGHAVGVWVDRTNPASLLPGGWTDVAFDGYPANQLYPSLATGLAAALAFVLPLAVAVKLIAVLPLVALPWSAWAAGRLAALPSALPLAMAAACVPFGYDTSCIICGGTVASTVNGEYPFAWGIVAGLLAAGLADRLLRTGRGAPVTALALAAALLFHPVPAVWTALLVGMLLALRARTWWPHRARVLMAGAAALLVAVPWWLPFVARHGWMPSLNFPKRDSYLFWLFPASAGWELVLLALAGIGAVAALRRRLPLLLALAAAAVLAALAFVLIPQGWQLFNLRVLPFWYLGRWLLAAVGLAVLLDALLGRLLDRPARWQAAAVPVMLLVGSAVVVGATWGWWGLAEAPTEASAGRGPLGVEVTNLANAAPTVLGGVEARADAVDLHRLQSELERVAGAEGCGRLAFSRGRSAQEPAAFGDVAVLWQAPIWTGGCLTTLDGLLVDSSATAPTALGAASLISSGVGVDIPGITQYQPDLAAGVQWLRLLGVRYFLTRTAAEESSAAGIEGLRRVGGSGTWAVWKVADSPLVSDLEYEPVVITPAIDDHGWIGLSMAYGESALFPTVLLAQSGPPEWPRAAPFAAPPQQVAEPAGSLLTGSSAESVTLRVRQTGRPVLVRVSAYPGWDVTQGEADIYRASANLMIVVPHSADVTITHRRTGLDWAAITLGIIGWALVAGLALGGLRMRRARSAE